MTSPKSRKAPQREEFLRLLIKSGLLTRSQLDTLIRGLPPRERKSTQAIADYLIKNGKLTAFQAQKLLSGSSKGLLLGPFEILAAIGRGGMSIVYLARDRRSNRLLALKILPPQQAQREERMIARFLREMALSQKVDHPHLARTFEAGRHEDIYFIAMEYIPGKSLYRLVNEEGPLDVARAVHLMQQAAQALEHAHQQGLIHRDMKPGNVMVTPNYHAKVLDLGFALRQGETGDLQVVGGQGYVVGTMDYIAPEQISDSTQVDPRADIYSLGCTLYFALTGRPPFPGGTSKEKMRRHQTEEPTPLSELAPHVPEGVVAIVQRMMAKDPRHRFKSAEETRQALAQWDSAQHLPMDDPNDKNFSTAVIHLQQQTAEEALRAADEALFDKAERIPGQKKKYRDQEDQELFDFTGLDSKPSETPLLQRPEIRLSLAILAIVLLIILLLALS